MGKLERRQSMALDDAYFYCRRLEAREERPSLYKVCNAIRTIDNALIHAPSAEITFEFCVEAWTRIRNYLFDVLVTHFKGFFIVYDAATQTPVEPGTKWPERAVVEFYPERSNRKNDSYRSSDDCMDLPTLTSMRWCFADGRQLITPQDFPHVQEIEPPPPPEEETSAKVLLERLYEVCETEAAKGKKKAHRKWWQLYWEANSCQDRKRRHQLHKRMVELQSIWGRPS